MQLEMTYSKLMKRMNGRRDVDLMARKALPKKWIDNLAIPAIAAPMFLVSGPDLVAATCKSGVIGSFPAPNARPIEVLDDWMRRLNEELQKAREENPKQKIAPWAMNMVVHSSYGRLEDELALIRKHKPELVITSLGSPKRVVEVVHDYGGLVFSDVSNMKFAYKVAEAGSDGLILVGSGAGGHAGPINSFAFMDRVREFWDGHLVLAGSISTGYGILAAQALGADLAYIGTKFIAAKESLANDEYKQMLIESTEEDVILTDAFSGVNANMLAPSIRKAGLDPEKLKRKEKVDFSQMNSGSKAWRDIWSAGHGVGTVEKVESAAEIITRLKAEYETASKRLNSINKW